MQSSNMLEERPDRADGYGCFLQVSLSERSGGSHGEGCPSGSFSASSMAARSSSVGSGVISNSTTAQAKVDGTPGRWELPVGRRLLIPLAVVLVPAFAGTAAAAPAKPVSWAARQIKAVTAAGLMDAKNVASVRADDPLTAQALEDLAFGLKQVLAANEEPPAEPDPLPV